LRAPRRGLERSRGTSRWSWHRELRPDQPSRAPRGRGLHRRGDHRVHPHQDCDRMIPPWVRWVEVAQVPDGAQAGDLQDWLVDHSIDARLRTHHDERPGAGVSDGYQVLPDRAPRASRYSIEVRREDLERTQEALRASGWQVDAYESRSWVSEALSLATLALTATVVIGLVLLIRVLGDR